MSRLQALLHTLPRLEVSNPHVTSPKTFPKFKELPGELQMRIWLLAAHEPRDIKLFQYEVGAFVEGRKSSVPGQPHVPPILQVSKEVRAEGRKYYTRLLERPYYLEDRSPNARLRCRNVQDALRGIMLPELLRAENNIIWVNFAVDRFVFDSMPKPLHMQNPSHLYNLDLAHVGTMKTLHLTHDFTGGLWNLEWITSVLQIFRAKEVVITIKNWAPKEFRGFEERYDVHAWIQSFYKPEMIRRLLKINTHDNLGFAAKFGNVKLKWESTEDADLPAWTRVGDVRIKDRALRRTWLWDTDAKDQ